MLDNVLELLGLLTHIQWVLTAQDHVLGNLPQGFRWINLGTSTPSWGPQSLACPTPPSPLGAQVSLCDQSLKHFVR